MENSVLNKSRPIQTKSNVFWTIQLSKNIIILVKTKNKFKKRTIWFIKIAKKHNLCFKQLKCDFDAKEISILKVAVEWEEVQI